MKKEYELATQLDHPNIVKVLAKEMNPEIGPCIVMEYIDGVTLDEFLATKPSVAARKKVVEQLVDALCYIHGKPSAEVSLDIVERINISASRRDASSVASILRMRKG